MANRRDRFRKYMACLAPAAPVQAIHEGFYVPRPGRSISEHIARRLEIDPIAAHLVIGGVGSGKTTQLLVLQKLLEETPDMRAVYIDIAEHHDLTQIRSGVLLVLTGLRLSQMVKHISEPAAKTAERFHEWAHGSVKWLDPITHMVQPRVLPRLPGTKVPVEQKGILVPPGPVLRPDVREMVNELVKLRQEVQPGFPNIIMLFDSLDRLSSHNAFAELVQQDLHALQSVGIGMVVTGPLHLLFGVGRAVADRFSSLHHIPTVDVKGDTVAHEFLSYVLTKRVGTELLTEEALQRIVEFSGGVLRDLLTLARTATEEAYLSGKDQIEIAHVESAVDAFGRTLMLGLGAEEIKALKRVLSAGTFIRTSDKDIALLVTRRVLEYVNGQTRYEVHPTIAPLLPQLPG